MKKVEQLLHGLHLLIETYGVDYVATYIKDDMFYAEGTAEVSADRQEQLDKAMIEGGWVQSYFGYKTPMGQT